MSSPISDMETTGALNQSLNGTARRLFYWLSMIVVLLIAMQTALDALNIRVLPHRAWAQGISPTVVQVPGGPAIYYKYVLVDAAAANEKFNLPAGAQLSFLGVS